MRLLTEGSAFGCMASMKNDGETHKYYIPYDKVGVLQLVHIPADMD